MRAWLRFLAAASFLTKVPLPEAVQFDERSLSQSPPFFPAVGVLIGLLAVALDKLASLFFPMYVVSVIDLAAVFLLTGGLHLDGLMDTADGLLSGKPRDRALEIMKDSRVGAMGVAAGILVISLKVVSLGSQAGGARMAALLMGPVLGRFAMVVGMALFPYARSEGGLGSLFEGAPRRSWVISSGALAVGLIAAVLSVVSALSGSVPRFSDPLILTLGVSGLVVAVATSLMFGKHVTGRLGGLTGDVYGAICELVETAVFVLATARWWM